VLRALDVLPSSQTLVFSKTSLQRDQIDPAHPRALYFNDYVYVGSVGADHLLEVAAADPAAGVAFYTLDPRAPGRPAFVRQPDSCLQCHGVASNAAGETPSLLLRSVYPGADGQPVLQAGTFRVNHETPFEQRWGGWYATGTHGRQRHLGNAVMKPGATDPAALDAAAGANVTSLAGRFDFDSYVNGGHSDLVALMVLEHQAEMHNRLARCAREAADALRDEAVLGAALGRPPGEPGEGTVRRLDAAAESLLSYLLFAGEASLTDPVAGTSTFAADFAARGPRDRAGRSLRDFDLKTRLFRHPCSYLIYSPSFDALPAELKDRVYRRLWDVLNGRAVEGGDYSHLKRSTRRAILEILLETKQGLPGYWKAP
jgi:hypothetical protein